MRSHEDSFLLSSQFLFSLDIPKAFDPSQPNLTAGEQTEHQSESSRFVRQLPGRGDHLDNLALACKTCNFIKSDRNCADGGRDLTRDEIVKKAKDFIAEERRNKDKRLQRVRELLPLLT
ncbi:MAG TPA: hypothetical protein VGS20_15740 [Candidatus Acidoferrales bacterium]|nr:hypothetical protein [Candidatus Acidoferrales bacterium]